MGRPVIGKKELLQWASVTSGKTCQRLEDLQDGSVLLRVFAKIWPQVFRGREERLKAHLWDVKRNWESLRGLFLELQLPLNVFDPAGIQRSAFKPCFAILVLCFFLQQLTEDRSFSCDFAYPIDQQLADFLQSRASIAALSRHGSLKESKAAGYSEETSQEEGNAQYDGMGDSGRVEVSRKAFTRLSQNSMGTLSPVEGDERKLATSMDRHHSSTSEEKAERTANGRLGSTPVEWRTAGMKAKGELLLANLRFENDSLRRQMEASVQERHFLMTRYEQECKEAAASHQAELQAQAEALRGEFAVERLRLAAERGRDQQRFVLELRKVADGLRAEAQRAARGDDAQPTVEETSKLRQQLLASACARACQEDQIAALEARCSGLEADLVREREEVGRLHRALAQGCGAEVDCSEILKDEEPDAPVASTGREAALMRQLRKLARDATQADLERQRVEEELKLKVWKLEAAAKEGARGRDSGETFGALLEEFEEEHTSERLRAEVKRLHVDNTFLRERAAVFDRHNLRAHKADAPESSQSQPATWLPRASVLKNNEEDERVAAELLELLKSFSHAKFFFGDKHKLSLPASSPGNAASPEESERAARLETQARARRAVELLWRMVVAQAVLKQRVARAAVEMRAAHEDARARERERAEERRAAEERLGELEARHKDELLALTNGSRQELALLTVKKGLLEGEVADLRREMDEAMVEIRRSRAAAQQQHEEKFQLLKKRLRESRGESSQLRLKEQHYARLAAAHKEAAALCEHVAITAMTVAGPAFQPGLPPDQVVAVRCAPRGAVEEIRALIKTKADLDAQAAACMDGIRAVEGLGGGRGMSEGEADELDQVVGEATEVLKAEVVRLEKAVEASRQKAAALTARVAELEVAVKQREQELTSEAALRAHARREAERLLSANAKLQKRLVEQKEMVDQDVSRLHVQLMEAMMRLDEQSAILDTSMRLGMMHDPAERDPERNSETERDQERTHEAGENGRRAEQGLQNGQRNGGASDRKEGRGSKGLNGGSGMSGSASTSSDRKEGDGPIGSRTSMSEEPNERFEAEGQERRKEGAQALTVTERRSGREALGVPQAQKWGGELLEVAEEDGWEEFVNQLEDETSAAEGKDAREKGYGRSRVASLTPIPETDSRQDSPEGASERKESATWRGEKGAASQESPADATEEEGAEAFERDQNAVEEEESTLLERERGLRMMEEGTEILPEDGEAFRKEDGTDSGNRMDGNGSEEATSDPIIEMIRRSSYNFPEGKEELETERPVTEPKPSNYSPERDSSDGEEPSAAPDEVPVLRDDEISGSHRDEDRGAETSQASSQAMESFQSHAEKGKPVLVVPWDLGDQDWVEKKVVGSSRASGALAAGGSGVAAERASEGRPAALSMHSHVLPDYVVNWTPPESPEFAETFPSLRSPVSPPPFALPDMA